MQLMLAVFVILALSAFFGITVLNMFGISLDVFSVAGELVRAWMGFSMLSKKPAKPDTQDHDDVSGEAALAPLILFAASPGTITGVITLSAYHTNLGVPLVALTAAGVTCLVTLAQMLVAVRPGSAGQQGESLMRDTLSGFMGLIVLAMGVQFALTGIKSFLG